MALDVVILAAGQGSRMRSALPKVLHTLAGRPLLAHVIDSARQLGAGQIHLVVGHGGEQVGQRFAAADVNCVWQREQKGTGHAVAQALPALGNSGTTLVLYGDVPLIQSVTLQQLLALVSNQQMGLLTVDLPDPTGYGRIVRDGSGQVCAIVEHKDADAGQRAIREVNTGILAVPTERLHQWLPQLSANNAQGEYYLTDVIAMAVADGLNVATIQPASAQEVEGVNTRMQLAALERAYQQQIARRLMEQGVSLADPARIDVRGELQIAQDCYIDINVIFEGKVVVETGVQIEANCIIRDSILRAGCHIKANSVLEEAEVGADCDVGPFARLRPGTQLLASARIGNFVETKNVVIGEGSKVNHLSYIGDASVGDDVNIGAGTITCNYDGVNKHQTVIGSGAFVGSNTALVAPVSVGAGATVGAGSTITRDVDDNTLVVARGRQIPIPGWQRPVKKAKE
ncbi:bifunctional UDP-N-acetylglucosamine diphosphorylase/glucosamine-1-phosphate N-acetyltransferase GlmU [Pokkaliibacter sp. MBI-7]|uniref:bifunctional UDP-N-acetylglucosamine diphosphorylase/glucosamine-1-phosphate N-acetyltransferase GlmU n=1 Tax=Pokkaliibacter sp. MBI-7 TaxID=3040600 RepID=UPI0024493918|nr:bifunctional UDP-N-acetylglucosamine diphosphorylase/glucosamine-1-phosphate N-acetyltransferase GlmU [Pokkaliibacter sp. MBI-7]MDH2433079.1 bifunctional UDP-N-acetylglucosamine diphosphorylase/glucosamine-1-phosphate N-acetyltransferase GlmU [Pokkaliibacter sp. MBI-7]